MDAPNLLHASSYEFPWDAEQVEDVCTRALAAESDGVVKLLCVRCEREHDLLWRIKRGGGDRMSGVGVVTNLGSQFASYIAAREGERWSFARERVEWVHSDSRLSCVRPLPTPPLATAARAAHIVKRIRHEEVGRYTITHAHE